MNTIKSDPTPTAPALFLIGFSSVIAQIVLMRELIVVFNGNEISLGIMLAGWLLWTAIGSGLLGRIAHRLSSPRKTVASLEAVLAVVLPVSIVAVRAVRALCHVTPGELLGPGPMFVASGAALSLFCLTSGALFAAGSRLRAAERGVSDADATGSVYLLEALGSGAGGIVASLLLIRVMSSSEIAVTLSILNLLAAWSLTRPRNAPSKVGTVAAILAASILWVVAGPTLETISNRIFWRGFEVVDNRNSPYGNLVVTTAGGSKSIYQNGKVLFTVPDQQAAEEAVHYALLQHEYPRSLLLVGGGINGGLAEALKHRSIERIDYVELDPALIELANKHLAGELAALEDNNRVNIHNIDGRVWLKRTTNRYDVIILNLPDPQTAQLNRFYSVECVADAADRLEPGGVFSFKLTGAENYISDGLAEFLRCINKTTREIFPRVMVMPGATIHFFATAERGATTSDSNVLLHRLRSRGIHTQYVNDSFLPFRMMPDRLNDLRTRIEPEPDTRINRDFEPIAYFYSVALWSTQFNQGYRKVFAALAAGGWRALAATLAAVLIVFAAPFARRWRGRGRIGAGAGYGVAAMGFTTIGLEVLLLLGFQAIYGYVYHQLAIIIAAFMSGMAGGALLALRRTAWAPAPITQRRDVKTLLALQTGAAVFPVALVWLFVSFAAISDPISMFVVAYLLFPVLAAAAGALGGGQFVIASRVYFAGAESTSPTTAHRSNPGALYALDLAGACLGAVALSAFLIPVFGFEKTAFVIAAVDLAAVLLIASALPVAQRDASIP